METFRSKDYTNIEHLAEEMYIQITKKDKGKQRCSWPAKAHGRIHTEHPKEHRMHR